MGIYCFGKTQAAELPAPFFRYTAAAESNSSSSGSFHPLIGKLSFPFASATSLHFPSAFFIFYSWRSHIHSQITRRRGRGQPHSFLHGADAVEHAGQPDKRVRARLILAKAKGGSHRQQLGRGWTSSSFPAPARPLSDSPNQETWNEISCGICVSIYKGRPNGACLCKLLKWRAVNPAESPARRAMPGFPHSEPASAPDF